VKRMRDDIPQPVGDSRRDERLNPQNLLST